MARKAKEQTELSIKVRGSTLWFQRCVKGELCRYSSGYKNTSQNMAYLRKNGEMLFWDAYNAAHNINEAATYSFKFKEYGLFVLEATAGNRNAKSQANAISKLNALNGYFKDCDISSISTSVIAKWQTSWQKGLWKPNNKAIGGKKSDTPSEKTILNYRGVLSIVLEMAVADGIINKNPLNYVKAPKVCRKIANNYTHEEIEQLIKHSDEEFANLMRFALWTGMRPSEIIALKWRNVNIDNGYIIVKEGVVDGVVGTTKSGNERFAEILPQLKPTILKQMIKTSFISEYVFLNQYNKPYIATKAIQAKFKELCLKSGVRVGQFYDLKRTFITWMRQNGQSDTWLTQQVGHLDSRTTDIYTGKVRVNMNNLGLLKVV